MPMVELTVAKTEVRAAFHVLTLPWFNPQSDSILKLQKKVKVIQLGEGKPKYNTAQNGGTGGFLLVRSALGIFARFIGENEKQRAFGCGGERAASWVQGEEFWRVRWRNVTDSLLRCQLRLVGRREL